MLFQFSSVTQSCPTVCDPMDCSLPGSSVQEFSRKEYWSKLPFPSPGDLPHPAIKPWSPVLKAESIPSAPPGKPHKSNLVMRQGLSGPGEPGLWQVLSGL